jgi:hypothetical protein
VVTGERQRGARLAEALADVGPGAFAIANEGPLFAADQRVVPWIRWTQLLVHLELSR